MALTWDKLSTRWILLQHGLPQIRHLPLYRHDFHADEQGVLERVVDQLRFPLFIKPSRTGSSIGISRAADREGLKAALDTAFGFDWRVIAEEGVTAREIEFAALGGRDPHISAPGEIVSRDGFYDFREKYLEDTAQLLVPTDLDAATVVRVREIVRVAWRALNCYGMARFDFLITGDAVYLNEINTIPGFTSISMYPKLLAVSGIGPADQMRTLIRLAFERPTRQGSFFSHSDWYRGGTGD